MGEARHRPLQERDVGCEQHQAERQHPGPKDRQEREHAADDEGESGRDSDQTRIGMAQPTHRPAKPRGEFGFDPLEGGSQFVPA